MRGKKLNLNWKETYTKVFLKELNKSTNPAAVTEHMHIWWQNTRNKGTGGLRLTEKGLDVVNEIGLKVYDVAYPPDMPLTPQIIIFLDQFIDCPYYIHPRSIIVTSEKKAVELILFSGDLRKYGIMKAMKRSQELLDQD